MKQYLYNSHSSFWYTESPILTTEYWLQQCPSSHQAFAYVALHLNPRWQGHLFTSIFMHSIITPISWGICKTGYVSLRPLQLMAPWCLTKARRVEPRADKPLKCPWEAWPPAQAPPRVKQPLTNFGTIPRQCMLCSCFFIIAN